MRSVDLVLDDLETAVKELVAYVERGIAQEDIDFKAPELNRLMDNYECPLQEALGIIYTDRYADSENDYEEHSARMREVARQFRYMIAEVKAYSGL